MAKRTTTATKANRRSETFEEKIVRKLSKRPALVTLEVMDEIEAWWKATLAARRCAFATLTKPWPEMRDAIVNDTEAAEALAAVYTCFDSEKFENLAKLAGAAQAGMMVALAYREDMDELMAKAARECPPIDAAAHGLHVIQGGKA